MPTKSAFELKRYFDPKSPSPWTDDPVLTRFFNSPLGLWLLPSVFLAGLISGGHLLYTFLDKRSKVNNYVKTSRTKLARIAASLLDQSKRRTTTNGIPVHMTIT
jgi:hypothetical protein